MDEPTFYWRSEWPSSTEAKRAEILASKPACDLCGRMFDPRHRPPDPLICRDCRDSPPDAPEVLF